MATKAAAAKGKVAAVEVGAIVIDENIPLPVVSRGNAKWPLEGMKVGQSFFVVAEKEEDRKKLKLNIAGSARRVKKNTGAEFAVLERSASEEPGKKAGVRCWKVKDGAVQAPVTNAPEAPAPQNTQTAPVQSAPSAPPLPGMDAFIPAGKK